MSAQTEPLGLEAIAETRERGRGGSLEILLNPKPPAANKPIILFHHIRKTAGTSLRHFFRANLPKRGNHYYVDAPESLNSLTAWHEEFYTSWTDDDRDRVIYIAGHSANYLLPLLTRPVRAFTIVRDPLDRTLSRYHFMKGREWSIEEFLADPELRSSVRGLVNGQSLSLLEPHFDVAEVPETEDGDGAVDWKNRLIEVLDSHYTLGVQDRFEASAAMFAHELGFKRIMNPKLRVNSQRAEEPAPAPEIVAGLGELNWLDQVLYSRAASDIDAFFNANPELQPRKRGKGEAAVAREILEALGDLADEVRPQLDTIAEQLEALDSRLTALERRPD